MPKLKRSRVRGATVALVAALPFLAGESPAQDKPKIALGETTYNTYCQVCHGEELVNTGQNFDLRRLKPDERPRFDNSVRNGKNQMPPWRDVLNDQQIDAIWAYIRSIADR